MTRVPDTRDNRCLLNGKAFYVEDWPRAPDQTPLVSSGKPGANLMMSPAIVFRGQLIICLDGAPGMASRKKGRQPGSASVKGGLRPGSSQARRSLHNRLESPVAAVMVIGMKNSVTKAAYAVCLPPRNPPGISGQSTSLDANGPFDHLTASVRFRLDRKGEQDA